MDSEKLPGQDELNSLHDEEIQITRAVAFGESDDVDGGIMKHTMGPMRPKIGTCWRFSYRLRVLTRSPLQK